MQGRWQQFLTSYNAPSSKTDDGLHVFCLTGKIFFYKTIIFQHSIYSTQLTLRLRLMLLNIFLDNIPIFLEGPLNCMCTHISKKVYVLTRKSTYPIKNHLLKSM